MVIFLAAIGLAVFVFRSSVHPQLFSQLQLSSLTNLLEGKISGGETAFVLGEQTPDVENLGRDPIAEPVVNVKEQTNSLLESVKKLPQDQLEAIKKQLCKELCGGGEQRLEDSE